MKSSGVILASFLVLCCTIVLVNAGATLRRRRKEQSNAGTSIETGNDRARKRGKTNAPLAGRFGIITAVSTHKRPTTLPLAAALFNKNQTGPLNGRWTPITPAGATNSTQPLPPMLAPTGQILPAELSPTKAPSPLSPPGSGAFQGQSLTPTKAPPAGAVFQLSPPTAPVLPCGVVFASQPTSALTGAPTPHGEVASSLLLVVANDLNFRFNKFNVTQNSAQGQSRLPLDADDFPLDMNTTRWLRTSTNSISVVNQADCTACTLSIASLVNAVGGLPTHPSSNYSSPFWDDLRAVISAQNARVHGANASTLFKLPKLWTGYSLDQVCEAVHDEFPGSIHMQLMSSLMKEGAKIDRSIIPTPSNTDFLRGPVLLAELNTWAIANVGPLNFGAKWFAGRARPEEVVFAIKSGTLDAPPDIKLAINSFNITSAAEFTAYKEGAPRHPSWPAMHSAASSASLWLGLVMNLTLEQLCEVKAVDNAISYARTVAGVHYISDNIAGLNMGQEVLAHTLPQFLVDRYGSDLSAVTRKVDALRFDWQDYLDSECF